MAHDLIVDKNGYELTDHGTTAFPAACYYDNLLETPAGWHWHDELEFVFVTEGSAVVSAGSEQYLAHKGDGIFINADVLHADMNYGEDPCIFQAVVFHPRLVGGSMDSIFWQNYLKPLLSDTSLHNLFLSPEVPWQKAILDAVRTAWESMMRKDSGYEFEVRNLLSKSIFLLCQNSGKVSETYSEKDIRNANRIKQMLQFIHDHITEDIRMEDIANSASISTSECLRCFKNTIHTTPIQYLLEYRLQKAAKMLEQTQLKITEIGPSCGFQDMSYFSRVFKRSYGCTPTEYKKRFL